MTRTELLAIMAASIYGTGGCGMADAVSIAEGIRIEVESRQPQVGCLCTHAISNFDGLHHDKRCPEYRDTDDDAEIVRNAALDEAIAQCAEVETYAASSEPLMVAKDIRKRIEALKSQPSKD